LANTIPLALTGSNVVNDGARVQIGPGNIGNNSFPAATVLATDGRGIPSNCNLVLHGGILGNLNDGESFTRATGTGAGQVQMLYGTLTSNAGFVAFTGTFTIAMTGSNGGPVEWGVTAFNPTALVLNGGANTMYTTGNVGEKPASFGKLLFATDLDLGGARRVIVIGKNMDPNVMSDWVEMSGVISGTTGINIKTTSQTTSSGLQGWASFLKISGNNTFNGSVDLDGWLVNAAKTRMGFTPPNAVVSVDTLGWVTSGNLWNGSGWTPNTNEYSNLGNPTRTLITPAEGEPYYSVTNGYIYMRAAVTLRYTGAGEMTDRTISVHSDISNGNGNANGSKVIRNDGSGPLVFTTPFARGIGTGSPYLRVLALTLGGCYTGTNEFKGFASIDSSLTSGAETIFIAVDGLGTWELTGTHYVNSTTAPIVKAYNGKFSLNMDKGGRLDNTATYLLLESGTFELKATTGGTQQMGTLVNNYGMGTVALTGSDVQLAFSTLVNSGPTNGYVGGVMIDYTKAKGDSGVVINAAQGTNGMIGWMVVKDNDGYAFAGNVAAGGTVGKANITTAIPAAANTGVATNYIVSGSTDISRGTYTTAMNSLTFDKDAEGTLDLGAGKLSLGNNGSAP